MRSSFWKRNGNDRDTGTDNKKGDRIVMRSVFGGHMKSIELFAGAGGLALGLEQAGFGHIGLVEFDRYAAATLKRNRPHWNVLCEDVAEVASRDLEREFNIGKYELDLLSGGAPCQSFSYAGKRLGLEDVRGTMFYHYAAFLHRLQSKGLISMDNFG